MEYHSLYGPSLPETGWVPAPSYLLRRQRIFKMITDKAPGRLLEIGCGAATLIHELGQQGFSCTALETSPAALAIARTINPTVDFHETPQPDWTAAFDYLMALEVLEHIEDDRGALRDWHTWLKPGGTILISVPAHMSKWTVSDNWAGHVRRYEKSALCSLLNEAGFVIEHFESYGFPLANMIAPLRARMHRRQLAERNSAHHDDREQNNAMSGVSRSSESRLYPLLKSLPGTTLMRMAFQTQAIFSRWDFGNGYVLAAVKPR